MGVNKRRPQSVKEEPLNAEINKVHSLLTDVSTTREGWRKVEDPAFVTIIKACGKIKVKISLLTGMGSDDALKVKSTFDELTDILSTIRRLFIDVERGIFEDEEQSKRYFGSTVLAMMEVWSTCCDVTVKTTDVLVQRVWTDTDEHKELIKSVSRTSSSCIKLLVLMADAVKHTVLERYVEKVKTFAIERSKSCSQSLEQLITVLSSLQNGHPAEDAVLDIITWMLYGLQHVANNVIKPCVNIETDEKDNDLFDFANSLNTLFAVLEEYETGPGLGTEKSKKETEEQSIKEETKKEVKDDPKKRTKSAKSDVNDKEDSKEENDTKETTNTAKKVETLNDCIRNIDRLNEEYSRFSETWLLNGKVGVVLEDNTHDDVTVLFRPEQYIELAKCSIKPSIMADRTMWLNEVGLSEADLMVSDIYIVNNGPLSSAKDVVIDFPVMTQYKECDSKINVKSKSDGAWNDMPDVKQEMVADILRVSFKTQNLEGFVAYITDSSDTHELTPSESTYTSPTDGEIQVKFQSGSVDENHNLKIKVLPYKEHELIEYVEKCPNAIVGITAISHAIEVRADHAIAMKKNTFYQLPLDEGDDNEAQIVVIRYNDEQVQILDKSQCHVKNAHSGVYTVETRGIWCIAIARVKKIFLNMRDTVKKEFQVMHGKTQICNIVFLIDKEKRCQNTGYAPIWIECVEKKNLNEYLDERKKEGFVEVRNSRSKDISMQRRVNMSLAVDGQIKILDNLQYVPYKFTYLQGADNHICIPIEVKRDQEKMPYATFIFKEEGQDSSIHSVAIPVRDLAELPTDEISAVLNLRSETNNIRLEMKFREESARNVLSHESLMCLSRKLTLAEAINLADMLGISEKKIPKFQENCEGDVVRTNFLILCDWRGNYSRSAMVDFLVSSLRSSGKRNIADVITRVRRANRVLYDSDFA